MKREDRALIGGIIGFVVTGDATGGVIGAVIGSLAKDEKPPESPRRIEAKPSYEPPEVCNCAACVESRTPEVDLRPCSECGNPGCRCGG